MVAQRPEGLTTLAEEFPGWEAASRWSRALEEVEERSRPYLKEVQRYEKYRCDGARGLEGGIGSPASQPRWAQFGALINPRLSGASASVSAKTPYALGLCLRLGDVSLGPESGDPVGGGPPPSH